ncbi:MAG: 2Fe-2S iron-sulfur cluster-binding protein [Deltaproteobacteria bacterium]|nr:2Fe-2S iron-sulfur cluster-binding protein [Deltaproteobacteria bacterium]
MDSRNNCVRLKILRYNPQLDTEPHYETYSVELTEEKMNLLQALETVYQNHDESLTFRRYCCGIQFCNSCLMLINGKPSHACLTIVDAGVEYEVAPLKGKQVLMDLIVSDGGM